jgi:hypothetical protein
LPVIRVPPLLQLAAFFGSNTPPRRTRKPALGASGFAAVLVAQPYAAVITGQRARSDTPCVHLVSFTRLCRIIRPLGSGIVLGLNIRSRQERSESRSELQTRIGTTESGSLCDAWSGSHNRNAWNPYRFNTSVENN